MKKNFKQSLIYRVLRVVVALAFWTGIWFVAAAHINKELLIPGPLVVVKRIGNLVTERAFWLKTGVSFLRVLSGFAIGCIMGVILAVLATVLDLADAIITPFIRILRSTPVTSFIILIMLWLSYTYVPVMIASLLVAPVIFMNLREGLRETDRKLLEVAKVFRFGKLKTVKTVYIPSVMPYFVSAAVTSVGLAWKVGIAAEVLCLPSNSIGREIYYSKLYLETPDLFAWTLVVIIFSFCLEKLLGFLVKRNSKTSPGQTNEEKKGEAE